MGMDYQYAGSASYPRFDREISDIVQQVFDGTKTPALIKAEGKVCNGNFVTKMFGSMSSMGDGDKYVFPDTIPENVAYFFNHLYDKFSPGFMEDVYLFLSPYLTKMEKFSSQFVYELNMVHECEDYWDLG